MTAQALLGTMGEPMTVIRPFASSDRAALTELFAHAGEGSTLGELWGHLESEAAIYLTPYMDLEPESLLLAEDGGKLVGYLAGSVGGMLPSEDERMEKAIKDYRLMLRPRALGFFLRALLDLAWAKRHSLDTAGDFSDPRWPAHLHINMLPEARGTGAADGLMERWLERLAAEGVAGCHLQTLTENTRAVRFFERMGFAKHGPELLVPGIRSGGKRLHQQTMVCTAAGGPPAESEPR